MQFLKYEDFVNETREFANKYPKMTYVELGSSDIKDYSQEIIDLINTAYSAKGGNLEFKKASDLVNSDLTYWIANDIDSDPDPDIVLGGKKTSHGTKLTVMGQDGSKEAKKEVIIKIIALMKTRGFYMELDLDLAQKFGLPHVKDEKVIRSVLNKDIKYHQDGTYDRSIAGGMHTKVLVGLPTK
jgi:hypothetical protein